MRFPITNSRISYQFGLLVLFLIIPTNIAYMDAAHPWQVGFQDPATPIMEGIIFFNGLLMTFMLFIAFFVGWLLYKSLTLFNETAYKEPANFNHSTLLEVVWTIIPAGILMLISVPSYNLLYAMEEVIDPTLTVKVVGHQWYWSYECSDFEVSDDTGGGSDVLCGSSIDPITQGASIEELKDLVNLIECRIVGPLRGEEDFRVLLADLIELYFKSSKIVSKEKYADLIKHYEALWHFAHPVRLSTYESVYADIVAKGTATGEQFTQEHQKLIVELLLKVKELLVLLDHSMVKDPSIPLLELLSSNIKNKKFCEPCISMEDAFSDVMTNSGVIKEKNTHKGCDKATVQLFKRCVKLYSLDPECHEHVHIMEDYISLCDPSYKRRLPSDWQAKIEDDISGSEANDSGSGDGTSGSEANDPGSGDGTSGSEAINLGSRDTTFGSGGDAFESDDVISDFKNNSFDLDDNKTDDALDIEPAPMAFEDYALSTKHLPPVPDYSGKDVRYAGLSKAQREAHIAEKQVHAAHLDLFFSDEEFTYVGGEFEDAINAANWAYIDLVSARLNKANAGRIMAEGYYFITSSSLIRSRQLLLDGFDSWTEELRRKTKPKSDDAKMYLIRASEEDLIQRSILNLVCLGFTPSEYSKVKAVACGAEALFTKVDDEVISFEDEFKRTKVIFKNAESDLKTFESMSARAEERIERVQLYHGVLKRVNDVAKISSEASKVFYGLAMAEVNGSNIFDSVGPIKTLLKKAEKALKVSQDSFCQNQKEYAKILKHIEIFEEEYISAQRRITQVDITVPKTLGMFKNLSIIAEDKEKPGKPINYFDYFVWDVTNRDLMVVIGQSDSAYTKLELVGLLLDSLEIEKKKVFGKLIDEELNIVGCIHTISAIKSEIKRISLDGGTLLDAESLEDVKVDSFGKSFVYQGARTGEPFELYRSIAEDLLISRLEKIESGRGFLDMVACFDIDKSLEEAIHRIISWIIALLKKDWYSSYQSKITPGDDICFSYINFGLNDLEEQLDRASYQFSMALTSFEIADKHLETLLIRILEASDLLGEKDLEKYMSIYETAKSDLQKRVNTCESSKTLLSLFEIKRNPARLEALGCTHNLASRSEVDNAIWLLDRLSDELEEKSENFVCEVRSEAIQEARSKLNSSQILFGDSGDGDPKDDSGKNTLGDTKNYYSISTRDDLINNILDIFKELTPDLSETEIDKLIIYLHQMAGIVGCEEIEKNIFLIEEIKLIKEILDDVKNNGDIVEEVKEKEEDQKERINFDSYLIADDDLVIPEIGGSGKAGKVFRLLEVDNRLVLPVNTHIRILVTSADVLHSWAVPSLGVKVDACPGRLNQVFLFVKREGVFYGQCSELCGVNHGFMPIVVEAVSPDKYLSWVGKRLCP